MKRIFIFGNGKLHKKFLQEIRKDDYVIGVDRAAYWLIRQGRIPDIAIGDFDSVTKKELRLIKKLIRFVKQYPGEKDRTDMELAIEYASGLVPAEVFIFGATGKRLDHTLATIHMIRNYILTDEYNRIRLIGHGKTSIERSSYRYISLLPYTKSITLTLIGFKYNVDRRILKKGTTLGVSNELTGDKGVIHIYSGRAWVVESRD